MSILNGILAFVGPTASGKSALAVSIAESFGGEIISCDSMQLYKDMNIGTAKPTEFEMHGIKHHMIDVLDMTDSYSVSEYVDDAAKVCDDIASHGKICVFCGGTGLYIDSFLSGIHFGNYEIPQSIRKELESTREKLGDEAMYAKLKRIDPQIAARIDEHNTKRVLRALEVYIATGTTLTEWNRRSHENAVKRDALVIGLDYEDRQKLYDRIDKRVDLMVQNGLVGETESLIKKGLRKSPTAGQAIGYKEFYPYFDGKATLEECVDVLKRNSRRYAKRQLTWFRRNPDVRWIFRDKLDDYGVYLEASELVNQYLSKRN